MRRKSSILLATVVAAVALRMAAVPVGFMLDVSRDKVPTMESLGRIVDVLSELGYSELQLYTEHTFAYAGHADVWGGASPLTPDEVRALDRACDAKGIALVANQNSFGHLTRWLEKPAYRPLAEAPEGGAPLPWGGVTDHPDALCVTDPASLQLVESWYDELLPCFRSRLVNIGGDEVYDLAAPGGRSRDYVRRVGADEAYLGFMDQLFAAVRSRGRTPMFWADFFVDRTNLVSRIPKDAIALDWGYDDRHPFERMASLYARAGVRYRLCPGTASWNALSGRVNMMVTNVTLAATAARAHGAEGLLLTEWGDGGHPQPFLAALPGLVFASAAARGEILTHGELASRLDAAMHTEGGGEMLIRYGLLHLACGYEEGNASPLPSLMRQGRASPKFARVGESGVARVLEGWHALREEWPRTCTPATPDWVRDGFRVFDLLYRALELRLQGDAETIHREVVPAYRVLWLRHNRPGGLEDSIRKNFPMD